MLDNIFNSIFATQTQTNFSILNFTICILAALILGAVIAFIYMFKSSYTKSFAVTLVLLPAIVSMVIMLVNGNLGTGIAVMGTFSLVRFRSVPGTAKEICCIFFAMAIGLAAGTGHIAVAAVFTLLVGLCFVLLTASRFASPKALQKELKITVPEDLDYTNMFDDIFKEYLTEFKLLQAKTTNMGSMYKLFYLISLKDQSKEKEFIDSLRCRNGNLEIICGCPLTKREEL